jgi:TonB family protein
MLTGEAPPIPSSDEKLKEKPEPSIHELHLLLEEMEDERSRSRWREAIWISVVLHLLVIISILLGPKIFPQRENIVLLSPSDQMKDRDMTFLDLPPDLQKHIPPPKTDVLSDKNRIATARQPVLNRKELEKILNAQKPGRPGPNGNTPKAVPQAPPQMAAAAPVQQPQQQTPEQKTDPNSIAKLEPPPVQKAPPGAFQSPMSAGSAIQQAAQAAAASRGAGSGGDFGVGPIRPNSNVQGAMDVLSDTMGVDFGPYLERVLHDVKFNWYNLIPEVARPPLMKKGKLTIEFAIDKHGSVMGMRLLLPSGDVSLDRAAWGGITASNPFPPLPSEFHGEYLALRFRFYYNPDKNDLR